MPRKQIELVLVSHGLSNPKSSLYARLLQVLYGHESNPKASTLEQIMSLRVWRFLTLLLTALSLTMESAHVLELPQKMQYDAQMYSAVNTTLYRYFAIVRGVYQLGAILTAGFLVFLIRKHRRSFYWTAAGALSLVLAFGIWLAVVAPVNSEVAHAIASAPQSVPALWMRLRNRWEYGHAAGFVFQVIGFSMLVLSVLRETPNATTSRAAR